MRTPHRSLIVGLALIAGVICSVIAPSQTYSAAWFYDVGQKQNSAVALKQFDTLENVFGKGFSVDLSAMLGTNLVTKNVIGGIAGTKSGPIAVRLSWTLGIGAKVENEQPTGWGPVAGVSYTANPITLGLGSDRTLSFLYSRRF